MRILTHLLLIVACIVLFVKGMSAPSADRATAGKGRPATKVRAQRTTGTVTNVLAARKTGETTASEKKQRDEGTSVGVQVSVSVRESTIAAELARSDTKTTRSAPVVVVNVSLGGELAERGGGVRFFGPRRRSLKDVLELFGRLREDTAVSTVVLEISALTVGFATVQEIAQGIEDLKRANKATVAILCDDSQSAYILATACDEIVMPPSNALMLVGSKIESYFFRGLLAKIGARAEVIHIGQYKSYGEMFTEDDFTTPARENMKAIVDDAYLQMVSAIAQGRKMTSATVEALIDGGPLTAREALEKRLVDRIAYREELMDEFRRKGLKVVSADDYGKDSKPKGEETSLLALLTSLGKPSAQVAKESKYPLVAVVYAVGPIVPGSSDRLDLSDADEIAADDYLKILDEIEKDNSIKGVILRVSSPGGSALASDVLFRRIVELGKRKPVVASMGDVAASGGYYIAMAAGKIIANPMTVTGSIGVVGGKIDLAGTYEKLGIRKTTLSRGRFANIFSETGGFSPDERAMMEKLMRQTYNEFVAKAATQRGMTTESLERIAQGRVYTGTQAHEVRLVDELGGFRRAVQEMKRQIGLSPDDKVVLVAYPKELTLLDVLQKAMGTNAQMARAGAFGDPLASATFSQLERFSGITSPVRLAVALAGILAKEPVALVMPFAIVVH